MARQAIALLVGEETLREAVDHYVSGRPGAELARFVLWNLHPWVAMQRCYEIYTTSNDPDYRRAAIELLRVVADRRVLPWVHEFLRDSDPEIQSWGIGIVDQLTTSRLISSEESLAILEVARTHANHSVRERAAFIERYLGVER